MNAAAMMTVVTTSPFFSITFSQGALPGCSNALPNFYWENFSEKTLVCITKGLSPPASPRAALDGIEISTTNFRLGPWNLRVGN